MSIPLNKHKWPWWKTSTAKTSTTSGPRLGRTRRLSKQLGLSQSELAGRLGEGPPAPLPHYTCDLLDLAAPLQEWVSNGTLSMGHAKLLAGIPDPQQQETIGRRMSIEQGLSVRNLENAIREAQTLPPPPTPAHQPPATAQCILRSHYATGTIARAAIGHACPRFGPAATKGRGKINPLLHILDQFDELMLRMNVSTTD